MRIAILAEQYDTFRDYRTDELPSFFVDTPQARYYNKTRIELPSVGVYQMGMGRTFIRGNGWQFTVHRRRLMKPVVEQPPEKQGGGGAVGDYVGPSGGWTRLHWFLDTKFDVLESLVDKPELARKYGRSTIGTIAPHGIIGQSFDGSQIAVSGKLDDYGDVRARRHFTSQRVHTQRCNGTLTSVPVCAASSSRHRRRRRVPSRARPTTMSSPRRSRPPSASRASPAPPRRAAQREPARRRQGTRPRESLSAGSTQLHGVDEETNTSPATTFFGRRLEACTCPPPPPPLPPPPALNQFGTGSNGVQGGACLYGVTDVRAAVRPGDLCDDHRRSPGGRGGNPQQGGRRQVI